MRRVLLLLLVVAACVSQLAPPPPPGLQALGAGFAPPAGPRLTGRARLLRGPSSCRTANVGQGNPVVLLENREPTAGEPWSVSWRVNPTAPYESDRPAFLLVWFDEAAPFDLSLWGNPGCELWAPLDPSRIWSLAPDGEMFRQVGGKVFLNWTPPLDWARRRVYCQLVVLSPGANPQGTLLAAPIELWVGDRR